MVPGKLSRRLTLQHKPPRGSIPPPRLRSTRRRKISPRLVALFERRREMLLRSHLVSNIHLVSFEPGRIEFRPAEAAPRDLANRLGQLLGEWTGMRWVVAVSQAAGAPTLATQQAERDSLLRNEVAAHPLVRAVLETFPGTTIASVRDRVAAADPGADTAEDEIEDDEFSDDGNAGEEA